MISMLKTPQPGALSCSARHTDVCCFAHPPPLGCAMLTL